MNLPQISVVAEEHLTLRDQNYLMSARERGVLVTLLRDMRAEVVVEIGVNEGRCAEIMLASVPSIRRYVGVDVEQGYVTSLGVQQAEIPEAPGKFVLGDERFELMVRPNGSLDLKPEDLPICDVMLIDGDHGRAAVEHDTWLAMSRVRFGGLICWHDYYLGEELADTGKFTNNPLDVTAVLNGMAARGWKIEHIENTWLAVMTLNSNSHAGFPSSSGSSIS